MVGLSVVLEGQKGVVSSNNNKLKNPQVISKTNMLMITNKNKNKNASSSSSSSFLEKCFLCKQKLLPFKDIYMYKGDRGFCSVECRYKQIIMDEEESLREEKKWCSLAPSSSTTSTRASAFRNEKTTKNRMGGGFAS